MLRKWLRNVLTKTVAIQSNIHSKKARRVQIPPSQKLLYGMYFAIMTLSCLTALEVVYMIVFRRFSSEIFSAITGLIGTILGIFLNAKA